MNKAKLKSYAHQARKDFIAAVTARANLLGLSSKSGSRNNFPKEIDLRNRSPISLTLLQMRGKPQLMAML